MGKYLFFDIDGTLIGPSKRVTKNTEEGIKKARANGHKTFLCTGRAPVSIMKSIRDIGFDGIISSAGGFVSIDGKYIFENFINQYVLSEVMLLFTNAKILFSLETKDALYQTPGVQDFFEKKQANILEGNLELARFLEDKLAFYDCVKYLSEFFNIVIFSKETDDFINGEIILKNCTKGDAMKRAVAYLGGDMKDTIAFGDSMNDFQMISEAAYGVVSYLAPDKLKAIADDTFEEPDDDGIFKCLQRLGLI